MSDSKPQLDPAAFSRIVAQSAGEEPAAPAPEPVHLSPAPDPDPAEESDGAEDSYDSGTAAAQADETDRVVDPYRRFTDAAGSEAADALRELHQSRDQPTTDDLAGVVREVYGKQYPGLSDQTTLAEVIVEAGGIADLLRDAGDEAPKMDISQILDLAVKNVLDPRAADDEALGHILDGQKHLIPSQVRDREAHAKQRRAKAIELLEQNRPKKEAGHDDQILESILDRDYERQAELTGGRTAGHSHHGTNRVKGSGVVR